MQANRIPAEGWIASKTLESLNEHLQNVYKSGTPLVKDILNYQVFFDRKAVEAQGLDFCKVKKSAVDFLKEDRTFAYVADMEDLNNATIPEPVRLCAVNGYNRLRSGSIQLIMQPGNYEIHSVNETGGTDHGVWNPYDAHIPLLFMGWGIKQGSTSQPVNVTDIVLPYAPCFASKFRMVVSVIPFRLLLHKFVHFGICHRNNYGISSIFLC